MNLQICITCKGEFKKRPLESIRVYRKRRFCSKVCKRPIFTQEWRERIRKSRIGKKMSIETRLKMSVVHKKRVELGLNHLWKGGIYPVNLAIRKLPQYKIWRNFVFGRDRYMCQKCSDNTGGNLEADHIKPLSVILKENGIASIEDAIKCKEIWDVSNGQTLCKSCHQNTNTYGKKVFPLLASVIIS